MSAETYQGFATLSDSIECEPTAAELAAIEDIASAGWFEQQSSEPFQVTLLELVRAVSEVSKTESEVVGTVSYMLSSGSVELTGSFRNEPVARFLANC